MIAIKQLAAKIAAIGFLLATAMAPLHADTIEIVGFGDSLMAGYQLPEEEGFTVQLEELLQSRGHDVTVTNAGVSGDTTTGGLQRLDWSVPEGTDLVIVELGANDALRGLPPQTTADNLDAIITRLKERGIAVLLAGMLAPPNMGSDYENAFNAIFPKLAKDHGVPLYPFFLEGVAARRALLLSDGMHPNADGIKQMASGILPLVETSIAKLK